MLCFPPKRILNSLSLNNHIISEEDSTNILRGQCNQQKNNENSRSNKLFPKITKLQLNFLGHVIYNKANGMHSITRKN